MSERFIGEDIEPVAATFDTDRMAADEPGLPREFLWRSQTVEIGLCSALGTKQADAITAARSSM